MEAGQWTLCHKHPLKIGLPGKLYNQFDYVEPVVDSLIRLHQADSFSFLRLSNKKRKRLAHAYPRERKSPECKVRRGVVCEGCGSNSPADFEYDYRSGDIVCRCGVTSRCRISIDEWSALHNAGDGRQTARADLYLPSSKALTLNQKLNSVFASEASKLMHAAEKSGFSAANKIVAANVAKESATDNGMDMRDLRKKAKLVSTVEDLLWKLKPIEAVVVEHVKVVADTLYSKAVRHRGVCGRFACQLNITEKPVRVLALKTVMYALESATKRGGINGVSTVSLAQLHGRVQSDQLFTQRGNATQHDSIAAAIVDLLESDALEPCADPAAEESVSESASETQKASHVNPPKRQLSGLEPSKLVAVRDAISKLASEMHFSDAAREAAIRSLSNSKFATAIKTDTLVVPSTPKFVTAYLTLRAAAQQIGCTFSQKEESKHAAHLGVEAKSLHAQLTQVSALIPTPEHRDDDDDLFSKFGNGY